MALLSFCENSISNVFFPIADMVAQYARNEQNMNSVERVLAYTELPPEGDCVTSNDPPASWPDKGAIKFTNVEMAYREGLPLVLKNISFQVNPKEKAREFWFELVVLRLNLYPDWNCWKNRSW